ncbi:MAG: fimbria major subunit, partial [Odoribacter sp.]|nr:fimbria major subunit [Odoribacter sp.]
NSFLMSNVALYDAKLPQKYSDWEEFATLSKPFKLTGGDGNIDKPTVDPIEVERSVARFDFKDGSPTGTPANTYEIISTGASNGKLQVELVRMSLVNMSNSFYYLKRVTTNEETGSDPIICGEEDINNWVIDTDWKERHKTQKIEGEVVESLKNFYNFRLFDEKGNIEESTRSAWNNHRIENVLSSSDNGNGYRIWRYVTENTIPGEMHQKNAISTGIVFKGLLRAVETGTGAVNEDLWKAISGTYDIKQVDGKPIGYVSTLTYKDEQGNDVTKSYPILYLFNDVLYVGWNHQIHEALVDNEGSPLADAAYKSFPDEGLPETVDAYYQKVVEESNKVPQNEAALSAALVNFRKAATKAGFTLYNASVDEGSGEGDKSFGAGYYCYYYYWNRHNDNGRPGTMGKMEFAVVRNNIYKLSVDNINYLGHPRRSDNDPEPPTPDSNDEEAKVYLQVSVEVRPWTVRMNSIEF